MPKPLNIWFDFSIFTIQQYGGISRYYCELARGLHALDQGVCIDAPLHINHYIQGLHGQHGLRLPAFRGVARLCQGINALLEASRLRRFAPDVVHETYFRQQVPEAAGACRVLTVYDLIHERFDDPAGQDALSRVRRAAVERSDHILCISHSTQRDLVELLGVDERKTSVVHLAASLSVDTKIGRPLAEPYILYVGPRDRYKNFACLLRAYASDARLTADFRLLCIGGGIFSPEETQQMQSLGVSGDRVLQMAADDRRLAACYRHAALFVYPSLCEGFGIPPLEAMLCGCPVVCADSSSLPEVAGEGALMFDPVSSEALHEAMLQMLYDDETAQLYRERGRMRAGQFSWQRCAEQTLDRYRQLTGVAA